MDRFAAEQADGEMADNADKHQRQDNLVGVGLLENHHDCRDGGVSGAGHDGAHADQRVRALFGGVRREPEVNAMPKCAAQERANHQRGHEQPPGATGAKRQGCGQ